MLIDTIIEIPIYKNSKNKNFYKNKGYNVIDGTNLILQITDLQKSSTFKVRAICDICGSENYIEYRHYLKNIQTYNYYSCHGKCSRKKFKNTNIERYNVENPAKLEETKNKMRVTNIEKYGCENVFQNFEIKEKIKSTNIEKYGCENPNQNKDITYQKDILKNITKKEYTLKSGYNFLFLIDKDYSDFKNKIK